MTVVLGHRSAWRYWKRTGIARNRDEQYRLFPYPKLDVPFEGSFCSHVPVIDAETRKELVSFGFYSDRIDIVVSEAKLRRRGGGAHCYLVHMPLPPGSFRRISAHVYVTCPELTILQMASYNRVSLERLIMLGYGIVGKFAFSEREDGTKDLIQVKSRCTVTQIANYLDALEHATQDAVRKPQGIQRARRALKYVYGSVESPQEARLAMLEFLPWKLGGENVRAPMCNGEILLPKEVMRTTGRNSFRGDFVWEEPKVVLEYNGAFHGEYREVKRDAEKYNALQTCGYEVVLATSEHIYSALHTSSLAKQLRNAIGQSAPRPKDGFEQRKLKLRRELGIYDWK